MTDNDESVPEDTGFARAFEDIEDQIYKNIYKSLGKVAVETENDVPDSAKKLKSPEELAAMAKGFQESLTLFKQPIEYLGTEEDVRSHPAIRDMIQSLRKDVEQAHREVGSAGSHKSCQCLPCFNVEGVGSNITRYGERVEIDCSVDLSLKESSSTTPCDHTGWKGRFESGYCSIADDTWIEDDERPKEENFEIPTTFVFSHNPRAYYFVDKQGRTGDRPGPSVLSPALQSNKSGQDISSRCGKTPTFDDPDGNKLEPNWKGKGKIVKSHPSHAANETTESIIRHHEKQCGDLTDTVFQSLYPDLPKTSKGKEYYWKLRTREVRDDCKRQASDVIRSIVDTNPSQEIKFKLIAWANKTHMTLQYEGEFEFPDGSTEKILPEGAYSYADKPVDHNARISPKKDEDCWYDTPISRYETRNVPFRTRGPAPPAEAYTIANVKARHHKEFSQFTKRRFYDMYMKHKAINEAMNRTEWIKGTEKFVENLNNRVLETIDTNLQSPLRDMQTFELSIYPWYNPRLQEIKCKSSMKISGMPQTSNGSGIITIDLDPGEKTWSYAPPANEESDVPVPQASGADLIDGKDAGSAASEDIVGEDPSPTDRARPSEDIVSEDSSLTDRARRSKSQWWKKKLSRRSR